MSNFDFISCAISLILWIIVVFNYSVTRDWLSPGLLQASVWAISVTGVVILSTHFIYVSAATWVLILSGVTTFTLSSLFVAHGGRMRSQLSDVTFSYLPGRLLTRIGISFAVLILPFVLIKAIAAMNAGPFQNWYMNLRYAVSLEGDSTNPFGIFAYIFNMSFVLVGVQLIRTIAIPNIREKTWLFIIISVSICYALLTAGRSIILSLLVFIFGILLVTNKMRFLRFVALLSVSILVVFFVIGVTLNKGGSLQNSLIQNINGIYESLITYIWASVPALDTIIKNGSDYTFGAHTFRTIYAILHSLGANVEVMPLVQSTVQVPQETNVYTIYQPYFEDYGIYVLPLLQLLLGFVYGFVYRKITPIVISPSYVLIYSLLLFPLFIQFALDQYMSLLSTWIQYAIWISVFVILGKQRAISNAVSR